MIEICEQREIQIKQEIQDQKILTDKWYRKMSGEVPWVEAERESMNQQFDRQNTVIRRLTALIAEPKGWNG